LKEPKAIVEGVVTRLQIGTALQVRVLQAATRKELAALKFYIWTALGFAADGKVLAATGF
jgi:hypothetical protein